MPWDAAQWECPHAQYRQSLIAVTPSMTFSRTAFDVLGRKTDPRMAGNETTTLPTVFRKLAGVKVRLMRGSVAH